MPSLNIKNSYLLKNANKLFGICFLVAFFYVFLLAIISGYSFPRASQMNFGIATMLTPLGLFKNFVLDPANPLRRLYFERVTPHVMISGHSLAIDYLYVFLVSNFLEIPLFYWALRKTSWFLKIFGAVTVMNALTHPFVFFAVAALEVTYLQSIAISELCITLLEALFILRVFELSFGRAVYISLFANLVSWQLGPIVTYLLFIK